MENQPTTLDKIAKISIIVGALIIALSVSYYLAIYIPQRDKAKIEQQKQEQQAKEQEIRKQSENLAECLKDEEVRNSKSTQGLAELRRSGKVFDLSTSLDNQEKDYQIRKADCFKKYPQ